MCIAEITGFIKIPLIVLSSVFLYFFTITLFLYYRILSPFLTILRLFLVSSMPFLHVLFYVSLSQFFAITIPYFLFLSYIPLLFFFLALISLYQSLFLVLFLLVSFLFFVFSSLLFSYIFLSFNEAPLLHP